MKKHNILKGLLAIALPIFCMSLTFVKTYNTEVSEENNFHGVRAVPFGRYDKDPSPSGEPQKKNTYGYNFNYMNTGSPDSADNIWNNYRGEKADGSKVTVAIIDSGIDIYHEDFLKPSAKGVKLTSKNVADYSIIDPNSCYIHDPSSGNDKNRVVTDVGILKAYDRDIKSEDQYGISYYSHGTAVASCIGAAINGVGGFGIAPNVNILFIRMDFYFTSLDVSIRYAVDHGADVINMSLGAYAESFKDGFNKRQNGSPEVATLLQPAINYATDNDVVVVAAAGNELTDHYSYPACNDGVIGVGALEEKTGATTSYYSNFNKPSDTKSGNHNVDVVAPGSVWTAQVPNKDYRLDNAAAAVADKTYEQTQGTSFASPLTAGLVALFRAENPSKTRLNVTDALISSCDDIGDPGFDRIFGNGRVNAKSFLTSVHAESVTLSPKETTLTRTNENPNPTVQLTPTFAPSDCSEAAKVAVYISDNEQVATVDDNGLVTALTNGVANITILTELDGLEGVATVTVNGDATPVIPTPDPDPDPVDPTPEPQTESITITIGSFTKGSSYAWCDWKVGSIGGQGFIYGGEKGKIQTNTSKAAAYIFNKDAMPGSITSITLTSASGAPKFDVRTKATSFGNALGKTVDVGTLHGSKSISTTGVTYDVSGTDKYFAVVNNNGGVGYLSSIVVNYATSGGGEVTPPVEADKITLDKSTLALKEGETATLVATHNGTNVTWASSSPNVATVKDGLVTAIAEGKTTITATNGTASAKCEVTVSKSFQLASITLSGNIPHTVPFKGTLDTSGVIVTANYTNNVPSKTVTATFTKISTDSIGKKVVHVKYKENGIEASTKFNVFVTNVGATRTESVSKGEAITFQHTKPSAGNNSWRKNGSTIKDNTGKYQYKIDVNPTSAHLDYTGNASVPGSQIGVSTNPATSIKVTSIGFADKPISKVSVYVQAAGASMTVSVGGKAFAINGVETVSTSSAMIKYDFVGDGTGEVVMNLTGMTKYCVIGTIVTDIKGGTVYSWSGDEQATSYINYLKTFRSCSSDWKNRKDIVKLVDEYNAMIQESKDSAKMLETFNDNGFTTSAIDKLMMIVDQYNKSLVKGETKLELILKTDELGQAISVFDSLSTSNNKSLDYVDIASIMLIMSLVLSSSIGLAIKLRRKHK